MMNKLKVPNYLLTLQSPVLAENTETICGVCHNLAFEELIDAQYELSDAEVLEIARKKIFDFDYKFYDNLDKRKVCEYTMILFVMIGISGIGKREERILIRPRRIRGRIVLPPANRRASGSEAGLGT